MISLSGSLEKWSATASTLFAPGCESQSFFLLSSFASPLMHLIRGKEGGALVALYGGKKSGKSTAFAAAGSVWGNPPEFNVGNVWADERYKKLAELQHLPALVDNLERRDPWTARSFLRTAFQGEVAKMDLWKGMMLSVASLPIAPTLKDRHGNLLLVGVEFPLTVPKALLETRHRIEFDLIANCGHAGAAFMNYLITPQVDTWCRQQLVSRMVRLSEQYHLGKVSESPHRFALHAIAGAYVAGMITTRLGLLDFDPERIATWAAEQALESSPPLAPPIVRESSPPLE